MNKQIDNTDTKNEILDLSNSKTKREESGKVSKKSNFLIFIIAFILIIILLMGGGVFFSKYQQEKIAKNYLRDESKNLSEIVELINDLKTEEIIDRADDDENSDFHKKVIKEETEKSNKVIEKIKLAKDEKEKRKKNKHIVEVDAILSDFYNEIERSIGEHKLFAEYNLRLEEMAEEEVKRGDELRKKYKEFIYPGSRHYDKWIDEARDKVAILKNSREGLERVELPKDLVEYNEKLIIRYNRQIEIIEKIPELLEQKKYDEYSNVARELSVFYSTEDVKLRDEAISLLAYYFDGLHEDFSSLEKKVDRLRSRMSTKAAELKVEVEKIDIERW